jgi:four helix bundle protein
MRNDKENVIVTKSFQFALLCIDYCEQLEELKKYVIARQLLKSSISIGANVREAQNAESRADFIHKMKIAAKEADETKYWLELCQCAKNYPECKELILINSELIKMLTRIISTAKTNKA